MSIWVLTESYHLQMLVFSCYGHTVDGIVMSFRNDHAQKGGQEEETSHLGPLLRPKKVNKHIIALTKIFIPSSTFLEV